MTELAKAAVEILDVIFTEKTMECPIILVHRLRDFDNMTEYPYKIFDLSTTYTKHQLFPDLSKIDESRRNDRIDNFIKEFNINSPQFNHEKDIKEKTNFSLRSSIFIQSKILSNNILLLRNIYLGWKLPECSININTTILLLKNKIFVYFLHSQKKIIENYINENPLNTIESYIYSKEFYKTIWYEINDELNPRGKHSDISEITINKSDIIGYVTRYGKNFKIYGEENEELEYDENFYYKIYIGQYEKPKGLILPSIII